uniref:C-type lectin domain-containing protein n=1 Tax=Caenorhabditis japonica TaxID=281687 RepID=A0A8R1I516_CAEJA
MSYLNRLILLIVSSSMISAKVISDPSFQRFCDTQDGKYTPMQEGPKALRGDTCEVPFIHWAKTKEMRWEFCTEYIPHTLLATKVVDRYTYTCLVESRVVCDEGWVQLHGICHKLIYEAMTKPEARARCLKERPNARIAVYHRPYMTRHWQDFFRDAIKLWVDASETITERLIYKRGPELMFAHDTMEYGLPSGAFVSVKSHKKAWPLCAYTPPVTRAESNYLMSRYSEIYYKTLLTPSGDRYMRTASSLQRDTTNPLAQIKYCENVMKPMLRSLNAQSAYPTRELIDTINDETSLKNTLVRFSLYSADSSTKNRISQACTVSGANNYGMDLRTETGSAFSLLAVQNKNVWKDGEPQETCDGATWSSGLSLSRDKPGLEAMSDARYGPIYCQTLFETVQYATCPAGWKMYDRKTSGQRWCRKLFTERKWQYKAEESCVAHGAHLDGFEDENELKVLDSMLAEVNIDYSSKEINGHVAFLGAMRRKACMGEKGGFNRDPNHQCSRRRVFEWMNGVARNSPNFDNLWAADSEPNLAPDEECLELLKGRSDSWTTDGTKDVTMKLNDMNCFVSRMYFCGKEASTITVPVEYT